ncbi:MAG: hypothetical protein ABSG15_15630, partial [FCB group bacterium]
SLTNSIIYQNVGKIGINTTTPNSIFEIQNSNSTSALYCNQTSNTAYHACEIYISNPNNTTSALYVQTNGGTAAEFHTYNTSASSYAFICTTTGTGTAAVIQNANSSNTSPALIVTTTGTGNALSVTGNVYINGNYTCTGSKSFVQQHPIDPNKEIVYVCLEGGEAGTYYRGSSNLVNGYKIIKLPEHFSLVTSTYAQITVQVTPRGDCNGLFVESANEKEIVVRESKGGNSNVEFDYFINGVRSGFENHEVIRNRTNNFTSK